MLCKRSKRASNAPLPRARARTILREVETLPIEILALIFGYTPLRARLLCISLVCKRWRTAALRSVQYFARTSGDVVPLTSILPLFPCIVELRVHLISGSLVLPATLQWLSINNTTLVKPPYPVSVTHLHFFVWQTPIPHSSLEFISAMASSLRSLFLEFAAEDDEGCLAYCFRETSFPALQAVRISSALGPTAYFPFLKLHSTQLLALGLCTPRYATVFKTFSFPLLQSCELFQDDVSGEFIGQLQHRSPQLARLRVEGLKLKTLLVPHFTSLVRLRVSTRAHLDSSDELPCLQKLCLSTDSRSLYLLECFSRTQLGRLWDYHYWESIIGPKVHEWSMLLLATKLRKLSISAPFPVNGPHLHFPRLKVLSLCLGRGLCRSAAVYTLRVLLEASPRLRELDIKDKPKQLQIKHTKDISALQVILLESVAHGARSFTLPKEYVCSAFREVGRLGWAVIHEY